jgi:hypothetical protein
MLLDGSNILDQKGEVIINYGPQKRKKVIVDCDEKKKKSCYKSSNSLDCFFNIKCNYEISYQMIKPKLFSKWKAESRMILWFRAY